MKFFFNGLVAIGVTIGASLVLVAEFFFDFFGASIQPSETFVAAVLGAAIALVGTLLTIYASVEAEQTKAKSHDDSLITSCFVKVQEIVNNNYHFRDHIRQSYEAVPSESHSRPGLFVLGLSGHPSPVAFSTDEKALFLRLREVQLANDISQLDRIHNSLLRAFEKYAEIREKFMSSTPARMDGIVGTSEFTEEEFRSVEPTIAQMDSLIHQKRDRVERDYPASVAVLIRIQEYMQTKTAIKVELEIPD